MVRVLIADDHPVFRFGLRTLLKADPAMEVVGEAVNGEEAIAQAASLSRRSGASRPIIPRCISWR